MLKLLFFLSVNFINGNCLNQHQNASFGETCTERVLCNSKVSLVCFQSRCQCSRPDDMIFNEKWGECQVLYGKRCKPTEFEPELSCIWDEAAFCHWDGYCNCLDSNYFHNGDGHCHKKQTVGGKCNQDSDCLENQYLICDKKTLKCACDPERSVFLESNGQIAGEGFFLGFRRCYGKLGASCTYLLGTSYIDPDFPERRETVTKLYDFLNTERRIILTKMIISVELDSF